MVTTMAKAGRHRAGRHQSRHQGENDLSHPVCRKLNQLKVKPLAYAIATAAIFSPAIAGASDWRFAPSLNVTETYTDNVRLAPKGGEQSDFVTQLSPGFSVVKNGPRLKLNANYALQARSYANNTSGTTTTNSLNSTAHGTLIQDLLLFDASANAGQQNISSIGTLSTSDINVTNNRTETRSYSVSPYLEHRFGSTAIGQLRYAHEAVSNTTLNNTNLNTIGNSNTDRIAANLASGPSFRNWSWALDAATQTISYTNSDSVDRSNESAQVGYQLTPTFRLTSKVGFEKDTYFTVGEKPEGGNYAAGFVWTPTPRTNLTADVGHRYFGRTYTLSANHRARFAAFRINYNEDITTSLAQSQNSPTSDVAAVLDQVYASQIPDPLTRQQIVDSYVIGGGSLNGIIGPINGLTNRYFLQKNLQASVALNGRRNTVIGTVFNTRRQPQSGQLTQVSAAGLPLNTIDDNSRQIGANAAWNLKISPRTNTLADLNYSRNTALNTDRRTTYRSGRIAMTTAFQPKLKGTLELRRSEQHSDFLSGDVNENAIGASLLMQF
jgi:uncharacterized protein (PEP-CTERM system associated)